MERPVSLASNALTGGSDTNSTRERFWLRVWKQIADRISITIGALDDPPYTLHYGGLRFVEPSIEKRFRREHIAQSLRAIRTFIFFAGLLYGSFGVIDDRVIPHAANIAWFIRFVVVCPWLLGVVLLTWSPWFLRFSQPILFVSVLLAGAGVIVMTWFAHSPGSGLYYAGLIIIIIYGASLIRLRCVPAVACSLLLVLLYQPVAIYLNPVTPGLLWNNDFFLITSFAMGVLGSYVQESQARRDFVSTERLREQKDNSERLRIASEAANKSKSDFLAVMSHELRTPLNVILGFSEIMEQQMFGPLGSERYTTYAKDIHSTAEHLLRIISDILDISKAEAGKLVLSEEDTDVWSIVEQCFRLLRERAAERGIRLSLRSDQSQPPTVYVDPILLKQAVINILGNAIKFTQAGGVVEGSAVLDGKGDYLIRITDTGIGIEERNLRRIVEPFVQVESALARRNGGTGLGLPLVKKIAELHGGKLEITSKVGVGTCVTVRLPAKRVVASQIAVKSVG